jgi:hypothetical protein
MLLKRGLKVKEVAKIYLPPYNMLKEIRNASHFTDREKKDVYLQRL